MSPAFLAIAAAVLVVLVGLVIWALVGGGGGGGGNGDAVSRLEAERANLATIPVEYFDGMSLGDKKAPLVMEMYEDFQCPFCLRHTVETEPTLVDEYVKTGKVRMVFKHLPILGAESVSAGKAGYCAAQQNKFWPFANRLFTMQAASGQLEGEKVNVGRYSDANLRGHAEAAGLDLAQYDACYASPAAATAVADDNRAASQLGLRSTPSFVFNGRPLQGGAPGSLDSWRALLDEQIAAALASPSPAASASASPAASGTASPTTTPSPAATPSPSATAAR